MTIRTPSRSLKRISDLQASVDQFAQFWSQALYLEEMLQMAEAEDEAELYQDTVAELTALRKKIPGI